MAGVDAPALRPSLSRDDRSDIVRNARRRRAASR